MTSKQYTKILTPLLPQMPGYVAGNKIIIKFPMSDFVRGLYFENTSDANCFHVHVFFLPLFVRTEFIYFNYGKRIGKALNWNVENINIIKDLKESVQSEAIPFLNNISTLSGVINFLRKKIEANRNRVDSHTLEAYSYALVKSGDYSCALKALIDLKQLLGNDITPWILEQKTRAQLIEKKLLQNPDTALAQLETWKKETVCNLGLEKFLLNDK